MRRVKIICFLTLKAPKKTYMRLERFFVLGSLWILGLFFMLLEAIDWFDKIPKVFHRCFGSKNISK
jgi:fumarate reductase subunit C